MTLSTVVVGVDGSEGSALALGWCAELARGAETRVVAVHAVEPGVPRRTIDEVEGWCTRLREAGVGYRAVVGDGDPRVVLVDVADSEAADLIVVGSRGQNTFVQLMLGSVGQFLVHRAPRPVAVVRPPDGAAE
jgi:nucleotide-binding universal stress UspA family protein